MAEVWGYARVSTADNQEIRRQSNLLIKMGVPDDGHIIYEWASGAKTDRPKLAALMAAVQPQDSIMVTEVSRLTRSLKHLLEIFELVQQHQLRLVIGDSLTIDCREGDASPVTKALFMILGVMGELERELISERVKTGIETARRNGKVIGRPPLRESDLPHNFLRYVGLYQRGEITITEMASMCHVARSTIYRYLRLMGIETIRKRTKHANDDSNAD